MTDHMLSGAPSHPTDNDTLNAGLRRFLADLTPSTLAANWREMRADLANARLRGDRPNPAPEPVSGQKSPPRASQRTDGASERDS